MRDHTPFERSLAVRFGRKHSLLLGHGSTAISFAITTARRLNPTRTKVLLPACCCPSIAQVILYNGMTPVFVDIDPATGNVTADTVRSSLSSDTVAVIVIHLFGNPAPVRAIESVCQEHGIVVIEDAAQSIGGIADGRLMGSGGHFSILSFGGTKIVRAGIGGVLLWDEDEHTQELLNASSALPAHHSTHHNTLLALSHRNIYHGLVDLLRVNSSASVQHVLPSLVLLYKELYYHRVDEVTVIEKLIEDGLSTLVVALGRRLEKAAILEQGLPATRLASCGGWRQSGVAWRFSLVADTPDLATLLTARLRAERLNASNHYWSNADLFGCLETLPGASYFGPRVVNLWVDDSVSISDTHRTVEIINKAVDGIHS